MILSHLCIYTSRQMNNQASRLLAIGANGPSPPAAGSTSSVNGNEANERAGTPSSHSTGSATGYPAQQTEHFLQAFLKLQADQEKVNTLWPLSQNVLLHSSHIANPSEEDELFSRIIRRSQSSLTSTTSSSTSSITGPARHDEIPLPSLPCNNDSQSTNGIEGPKSPEDLFKDEECYYRFAWPMVVNHRNSIAHAASLGRAIVKEVSERWSLGYREPGIE